MTTGTPTAARKKSLSVRIKRFLPIYLLMAVPFVLMAIYNYYPILLQLVLSCKKYKLMKGIWGSEWVGLANFRQIFSTPTISRIFINTIRISVLRLLVGFLPPIILSIMLFDMSSNRYSRISQSILYIPHFFSWVVVYGIVMVLFQTDGYINNIRAFLGMERIEFMMLKDCFLPILLGSGLWKGLGWSTIIYLAALTGISPELYEVAKIDGAGPIKRILHVTLPGITSVVVFQLTMSLGGLLGAAGTEQILLFYSPSNYSISDVIGTWVYRQGLSDMKYDLSAAVSVIESTVGLTLVLVSNALSRRIAGVGIW